MALVAGTLVLAGCDSGGGGIGEPEERSEPLTVAEYVGLSGLPGAVTETLLGATALSETLNDTTSTFTVFAPANGAYAPLDTDALTANPDLLTDILEYHVVEGSAIRSGDITEAQSVSTLQGSDLSLVPTESGIFVGPNGGAVALPDLDATNGVVHFINRVLLHQTTLNQRVDITANLDTLNNALNQTSVDQSISGSGPFTVFAPTDDVVSPYHVDDDMLPAGAANILEQGSSPSSALGDILEYHVASGDISASDLAENAGGTQSTVSGDPINVDTTDEGNVTLNGVPVATADVQVANGRIHFIEDLLLQETTISQRASFTRALDSLTTNIDEGSITSDLSASGPYTVFAPVNGAFGAIDDLSGEAFQDKVLNYHVSAAGEFTAQDIKDRLETDGPFTLSTDGGSVRIDSLSDGTITVNGREVVSADVQTSNGVVHVLGDVLLGNLNLPERATVEPAFNMTERAIEWIGAVQNIGLAANLSDPGGTFTVFAPTNPAFTSIFDPAALRKAFDVNDDGVVDSNDDYSSASSATQDTLDVVTEVLNYHVFDVTPLTTGDIPPSGQELATTDNNAILFAAQGGSGVVLNPTDPATASISPGNLFTTNGIIHGINAVQRQGLNAADRAQVEPSFALLEMLIEMAGTSSDLTASGPYTVLAPTNQAILARFDDNGDGTLQSGELPSASTIQDVLDYHIVSGAERFSGSFNRTADSLTTDQGQKVGVKKLTDGTVVVNDSVSVTIPDADVSNGVVHGVDTVLLP